MRAFTLIELSIVLIIIGLLVAGVLAGRELIEQAKLRTLTQEWSDYQRAVYAYQLKYDALPGDDTNAITALGATANGNSNNIIELPNSGNAESWLFWQHLALAEVIEQATYSGVAGPGGNNDATIGVNVPGSDFGQGGWCLQYLNGIDNYGNAPINHAITFGDDSVPNGVTVAGLLTVEQVFEVDTKLDDGIANTGQIRTRAGSATFNTATCTTGTAPNHNYNLSSPESLCNLVALMPF